TKLVPAQLRNRSLTDVFEPGTTMKPLTMMAALETGRYPFNHTINTIPGYIQVGSKTLLDPLDYGVMDLTKIITISIQVGIT
ncbi:penicillin-binding transpeptidase domain-containing protein, partial [Saccharophagus degradans]